MKHILYITLLLILTIPSLSFAHVSSNTDYISTPSHMMMFEIEDKILDDATHEKMEELMDKMMEGTLTEDELGELGTLGEEYPAPYTMMFERFSDDSNTSISNELEERHYMMGYGGHHGEYYGTSNFIGLFIQILVLTILLLIIAVLAKWVRKTD